MDLKSGERVLCEVKLSESDFGTASSDARHQLKLKDLYRDRLQGKVQPACLEPATFFGHYQILRNLCYLGAEPASRFVVILPRANSRLLGVESFLRKNLVESMRGHVIVVYLENLVERIVRLTGTADDRMRTHFMFFKEKYIPNDSIEPTKTGGLARSC